MEVLLIGIPSRRQILSLPNLTNETLPSTYSQVSEIPTLLAFFTGNNSPHEYLTFLEILYS